MRAAPFGSATRCDFFLLGGFGPSMGFMRARETVAVGVGAGHRMECLVVQVSGAVGRGIS